MSNIQFCVFLFFVLPRGRNCLIGLTRLFFWMIVMKVWIFTQTVFFMRSYLAHRSFMMKAFIALKML